MIVGLATILLIWLFAVSADFIAGTIMFRVVVKKWWWEKDIKKPWEFTISSDGWSFSAQDFNPIETCLLYTSPSPRDRQKSRMPSSA